MIGLGFVSVGLIHIKIQKYSLSSQGEWFTIQTSMQQSKGRQSSICIYEADISTRIAYHYIWPGVYHTTAYTPLSVYTDSGGKLGMSIKGTMGDWL